MKPMKSLLAGSLLAAVIMTGLSGCKEDSAPTGGGGTTVVPITDNLFPIVAGRKFTYTGFATAPGTGSQIPDPGRVYNTIWTVAATAVPTPLGGTAAALIDTTTGPFGPGGVAVTVSRTLLIRKDTANGDLSFLQSIGPFKRAFGIPIGTSPADTLIWAQVARPSQGSSNTGVQWKTYDSTFTGTGGAQVRLEIFGKIETRESITDSSSPPVVREVYRSRTWRKITVGGTVVQDDATTSRIWLQKDIGPAQVRIVEDTENIGHFRVLKAKNF